MDAVLNAHPGVWLAVHLAGIILAVSSRNHLKPVCAVCTSFLLSITMGVVAVIAVVGFLSQQSFWAASGCTLGLMAVVVCIERTGFEPDRLLQSIAQGDDIHR
ncbi:hypothetical protein [Aeoliella mucimassa]|uniref:Uncharacterized protein n=1 Tax=Aeoliella mucimassa TaxID=2527972 RepID=A0A518AN97_9BACT|nr:hypothetical protein [Aeoliella mucimassa]QDU56194.1 hypothetical protein Pan181_24010 [Aeoliella mucimassa]